MPPFFGHVEDPPCMTHYFQSAYLVKSEADLTIISFSKSQGAAILERQTQRSQQYSMRCQQVQHLFFRENYLEDTKTLHVSWSTSFRIATHLWQHI